jgi:anti-sigma B factor antagonist
MEGLLDAVVDVDDRYDAVVMRLSGEIDYYTAPILREVLTGALSANRGRRLLVLDLEQVEFIGSQGLAELVTASDRARQAGMAMRLAAANHTVRMLLAVTGTGELFALHATVAGALAERPTS